MGALDYLSDFWTVAGKRSKWKPMQTVEIRVKMDCEGCERKVRDAVNTMKGVNSLEVNRKEQRVTVSGFVDPGKVLNRVRKTGKKADLWPFIPQHLVHYPYVTGAYDIKAPVGFVRNVGQAFPATNASEDNIVSLFSDDNVHACSIM